ncbi:MAG: hypothetical protein V1722_05680 [Candidatus Micrarchaeota archaeon]
MLLEIKFLIALFATLAIEVAVVLLLAKFAFKLKDLRGSAIVAIVASTLTLPYLWFIFPPFLPADKYLLFGEIIVIALEALIYRVFLMNWKQAGATSIVANVVSFYLGGFIL